jgi:hypothetical protein
MKNLNVLTHQAYDDPIEISKMIFFLLSEILRIKLLN